MLCLVELGADGIEDASRRALHLAGALAEAVGRDLGAVVVGEPSPSEVELLGEFGVDEVHALVSPSLHPYAALAWGQAIADLVETLQASSLVAPATDRANEVMSHVAASADMAFVPGCLSVGCAGSPGRGAGEAAPGAGEAARGAGGGALRAERQRWGGSLIEEVEIDATRFALGAAPVVPAQPSRPAAGASLRRHDGPTELLPLAVRVVATSEVAGGTDLASARVVVGGGRGVGGPGNFAALDELAELLGGAVGVSRVVTGLGWRPHAQQVGQTGTRITPELYLACGISGAIQHLAGCQTAKHLVAINTDPEAPIMSSAEYAVLGDLNEVVPALIAAIATRSAGR